MFQIGSRVFLVVANGHRLHGNEPSRYAINSTIYELDMKGQIFVRFQDIITYRFDTETHSTLEYILHSFSCVHNNLALVICIGVIQF